MEEFIVELSPEEEALRQVIEPLLVSEGFEVVCIKLKKATGKSLLAIFIDTINQKNGVVLENLTDVSRLLSDVLDASFNEGSVLVGRYDLEVSSPGVDRPLSKRGHFNDAVGEKVRVRLKSPHATGSKNIIGTLCEIVGDSAVIEPEHKKEEKLSIAFSDIADANIVFDFSRLNQSKKKVSSH